jgi:hypothetical protein
MLQGRPAVSTKQTDTCKIQTIAEIVYTVLNADGVVFTFFLKK